MTQLKGPLRVIGRDGDHYEVDNTSGHTRGSEFYHVSNLRIYYPDNIHSDPAWIARRDYPSVSVVAEVIDHYGDLSLRKTLSFLCKWEGFENDEKANRWLPYSELRDNVKLHEYLRKINAYHLIPDEHKYASEFTNKRYTRNVDKPRLLPNPIDKRRK
jgi:hypothetical protein